jgi:hypothetical protein
MARGMCGTTCAGVRRSTQWAFEGLALGCCYHVCAAFVQDVSARNKHQEVFTVTVAVAVAATKGIQADATRFIGCVCGVCGQGFHMGFA